MVNWMKRTLKQARKGKEHVIITSHHPYGAPENVIECDEIFTAILANYSDIIVWHPVGHIHRDEFRIVGACSWSHLLCISSVQSVQNTKTSGLKGQWFI